MTIIEKPIASVTEPLAIPGIEGFSSESAHQQWVRQFNQLSIHNMAITIRNIHALFSAHFARVTGAEFEKYQGLAAIIPTRIFSKKSEALIAARDSNHQTADDGKTVLIFTHLTPMLHAIKPYLGDIPTHQHEDVIQRAIANASKDIVEFHPKSISQLIWKRARNSVVDAISEAHQMPRNWIEKGLHREITAAIASPNFADEDIAALATKLAKKVKTSPQEIEAYIRGRYTSQLTQDVTIWSAHDPFMEVATIIEERLELLKVINQQLPPRHRKLIKMRFGNTDATHAQIAKMLGISEATVESYERYILEKLRVKLNKGKSGA